MPYQIARHKWKEFGKENLEFSIEISDTTMYYRIEGGALEGKIVKASILLFAYSTFL